MKPDLYTKVVLTVIALLLAAIVFKQTVTSNTAQAAAPHQYGVEISSNKAPSLHETLNKSAANGWELVATVVHYNDGPVSLIFRK